MTQAGFPHQRDREFWQFLEIDIPNVKTALGVIRDESAGVIEEKTPRDFPTEFCSPGRPYIA